MLRLPPPWNHHGEWVLKDVATLMSCGHTLAFEHVQDLRVQLKAKQFVVPKHQVYHIVT